jgi:hypothetical protein
MADHARAKEVLADIERGMDGVTDGPWVANMSDFMVHVDASFIPAQRPIALCATGEAAGANASHIARCDPDNMRTIIDSYRALERERDAALAQVAALRSLVEEYYQKTPLGHQPHMISQRVEDALADTSQAAADHERRVLERAMQPGWKPPGWEHGIGTRLTKVKGSNWTGPVVGFYRASLTEFGCAVESENEPGNVQIYPAPAFALAAKEGEG